MALTTAQTTEKDALLGAGTKLGYRVLGSTGTYTDIAAITSVGAPKMSVGKVESIRLNSTQKNYRPTLPDKTSSFAVQHIPHDEGVAYLRGAMSASPVPVIEWQIKYSTGHTDEFPGFPESYEPGETENEGLMNATIGIQITGPVATNDPAP